MPRLTVCGVAMGMSKTVVIGMLGGAVAVAGTGGGAAYYIRNHSQPSVEEIRAAEQAAAQDRYVQEEEINYATLISTIDGSRASGGSMPVMVTFHLAGEHGLGEFCAQRPLVEEAVLRALERDGLHAAIREAVNRVLAGGPVRGFSVRPMTDVTAGGKAEYDTAKKCKRADQAAKKTQHG